MAPIAVLKGAAFAARKGTGEGRGRGREEREGFAVPYLDACFNRLFNLASVCRSRLIQFISVGCSTVEFLKNSLTLQLGLMKGYRCMEHDWQGKTFRAPVLHHIVSNGARRTGQGF